MDNSRVNNSLKNIRFSLFGQLFGILISFISRTIFVMVLSSEYLGLSGLFSNVLSILSLAEMGFGTAVSYELYKPLSNNDTEKIKSLMHFYKKIYTIIGIVMIILGIFTLPIYPLFIKNMPNISNLNLIYILFVLNSAFSYFLAYKRILLVSDQKRYIETTYKYIFYFLLNFTQILILLITRNYLLFLILQVIFTILENLFISHKVNKLYPYLLDKKYKIVSKTEKNNIFNNVKSMFFHKFGGVVLTSTDNIVTSKYIGLFIVGLYSNYFLIISAIDKILSQIFTSLIASIGNLNVTSTRDKKTEIFLNIFFVNFCIYVFISSCLLNLFNPFIELWLGKKYLLSFFTVIIIVINIYIHGMRRTAMAFREATGNYSKDWFSPLIEAIINIIISIELAKLIGLPGVFIGTIISSLLTNFWIEPQVIIKESINFKLLDYFKLYLKYFVVTIISCWFSYYLCSLINTVSIISIITKLIISILIPLLLLLLLFNKNENFIKIKKIIFNSLKKFNKI